MLLKIALAIFVVFPGLVHSFDLFHSDYLQGTEQVEEVVQGQDQEPDNDPLYDYSRVLPPYATQKGSEISVVAYVKVSWYGAELCTVQETSDLPEYLQHERFQNNNWSKNCADPEKWYLISGGRDIRTDCDGPCFFKMVACPKEISLTPDNKNRDKTIYVSYLGKEVVCMDTGGAINFAGFIYSPLFESDVPFFSVDYAVDPYALEMTWWRGYGHVYMTFTIRELKDDPALALALGLNCILNYQPS